jgi:hypothetical protein
MRNSPSQVERRQPMPLLVCRLWAGLACGMLAGAFTVAWFALHSLMRGDFWWSKFNVAAGWFYGMEVYHAGLSRVTLCGAAVVMLFYCLAGAGYAWPWGALIRARTRMSAVSFTALTYIVAAHFFWPAFGPFARLWFPWTATAPAAIALFVALVRYPLIRTRIVNEFGSPERPLGKSAGLSAELADAPPAKAGFVDPPNGSSPAETPKD